MAGDLNDLTQRQRVVWSAGDYPDIARTIEPVAHEVVATLGSHMPPPPDGFRPPVPWGVEDVARELLGDAAEVTCERRLASDSVPAESPDAWVSYIERALGPTVLAKAALEPQGRWEAARADPVALYEQHNAATDGTMLAHPEYLLPVARLPG